MIETQLLQFNLLKKEVSKRFLSEFPGTNPDISSWKGIDIVYFQEHLLKTVKGNVSEKWFYTYFKQETTKLPRIDMLNLLSIYVDYQSWNHFTSKNPITQNTNSQNITQNTKEEPANKEKIQEKSIIKPIYKNKKKYWKWIAISFILISFIITSLYLYNKPQEYTFCFYDSDSNRPITNQLKISIHQKSGDSNKYLLNNSSCFTLETEKDTLELTVNSKFHKQTTFKYVLSNYKNNEIIQLEPDEYALMLNYYATSKQKLKERQNKLRHLIASDALIYQVYDDEVYGVEVLTKEQYIGLLTLPTKSLRNYIQIYSKTNKEGKISKIKFKIQNDEH